MPGLLSAEMAAGRPASGRIGPPRDILIAMFIPNGHEAPWDDIPPEIAYPECSQSNGPRRARPRLHIHICPRQMGPPRETERPASGRMGPPRDRRARLVYTGASTSPAWRSNKSCAGTLSLSVNHLISQLLSGAGIHTVDYDPFIQSQLASCNQLEGLTLCKIGHVTL